MKKNKSLVLCTHLSFDSTTLSSFGLWPIVTVSGHSQAITSGGVIPLRHYSNLHTRPTPYVTTFFLHIHMCTFIYICIHIYVLLSFTQLRNRNIKIKCQQGDRGSKEQSQCLFILYLALLGFLCSLLSHSSDAFSTHNTATFVRDAQLKTKILAGCLRARKSQRFAYSTCVCSS